MIVLLPIEEAKLKDGRSEIFVEPRRLGEKTMTRFLALRRQTAHIAFERIQPDGAMPREKLFLGNGYFGSNRFQQKKPKPRFQRPKIAQPALHPDLARIPELPDVHHPEAQHYRGIPHRFPLRQLKIAEDRELGVQFHCHLKIGGQSGAGGIPNTQGVVGLQPLLAVENENSMRGQQLRQHFRDALSDPGILFLIGESNQRQHDDGTRRSGARQQAKEER